MTMTTRRAFTFASLGLAVGGAARAGAPQQQAAMPSRPTARWSVERKTDELVASVVLCNTTAKPLSVLTKSGSRPGGSLQAALEVEGGPIALAEVQTEADRREMMSRMGPIPQFVEVAPGADIALGPWRFTLPKGAKEEPVSLVAQLYVGGETIELRSGILAADGKADV